MRKCGENGLTLMELLITVTILLIIAAVATPLLSSSLDAHRSGIARSRLYQEGLLAIERMTAGAKKTTFLTVPNNRKPSRDILAFSRLVNTDGDFYFGAWGNPLFPRIDEDTHDYFSSGGYGIRGVDEDGDELFDEGQQSDDDEDGLTGEDKFDGLDNDLDGNIDENVTKDMNQDGAYGIKGIDDDGDGQVDEGVGEDSDDDEDGLKNEEVVLFAVYLYNSAAKTLTEIHSDPVTGILGSAPKVVLSDHVTNFEAFFEAPERIRITLSLTGDNGESATFTEYVCPRNVFQKTGKRVR
ncbi:MAG: type II secretion system protein [Desulfobacterales bacterium]|nr:type II secretion system protein [Desulfobacterales bacterium]